MAAALLALPLLGCPSGPEPEPERASDEVTVSLRGPEQQRLDLDGFEYEWDDIDIDDRGRKDPVEVASWATERHNAALRCLQADPPAIDQAVELMESVLRRVPDNSKLRELAARTQFRLAAYWFQAADALYYDMRWVDYKQELPPGKGGRSLSEEEVTEFIASAQPQFEAARKRVNRHARDALRHYLRYRAQRPDDKSVADKLWRVYFFLQDYPNALRWLDYVISELEVAEVPREDPLRRDYEDIREILRGHLAQRRIEGGQAGPAGDPGDILPWTRDRQGAASRRDRIGGGLDWGR